MTKIIKRKIYLNKIKKYYKKPLIKVITWMRRTWKSYFLKSVFNDLIEKNIYSKKEIFYINKELLKFDFISDYKILNEYFLDWINQNWTKNNFLVAIDEIQLIKWWEKFINSILSEYQTNTDIFITWSNSNLLSSELSTYISWRYIEFHIYPLNFSEFLYFNSFNQKKEDWETDIKKWKNNILNAWEVKTLIDLAFIKNNKENTKKAFQNFLKYWWLPWIFNLDWEEEVIYDYLNWVYNTIFLKDILSFNKIKNSVFFEKLYQYLFKNIWTLFSAKKIKDYTQFQNLTASVDTIINYINLWLKTYLIHEINRFDIKWKKVFQINNKYYIWDIWIRNALVWFSFKYDIWNILENIVYLELKTRWYKVKIWTLQNKEIDFVAEKNWKIRYYQVCYILSSEKVKKREFWNLLSINDNRDKYVLSMDEIFETKNDWIIHKNIIDWLLE